MKVSARKLKLRPKDSRYEVEPFAFFGSGITKICDPKGKLQGVVNPFTRILIKAK